ncbi:M23 family peptidase [Treponema phagedenis]|uniref:Peptidase, M23 family n=1 Tax=Treponema phagedenis TaxID=162 RepID=A0A0B7H0Y3_TREPH|nr:M23 family metallopeptidase [Treponema phagedenis]QSH99841.1 M23 family peptidase [Treponema phagedenis]CEM62591.1 Peptidase, M23 family [Treponema phagedenis]
MRLPARYVFFLFFLNISFSFAQSPYPKINSLEMKDIGFQQYSDDVRKARMALAEGKKGRELPISFYAYVAKKNDTIIRIAARCSIPYDSIVSLNRIESVSMDIEGKTLILPSVPGLYVAEKPGTPIENLLAALSKKINAPSFLLPLPNPDNFKEKINFLCIPNAIFDGTVRIFFLKPFYRFPLDKGILTSGFGNRPSPFTGKPSYHAGIDLAAPMGSPVYACAAGEIKKIATNNIYGKHIILKHIDGRESLYGHLSAVEVQLHQKVKSGKIIGKVGMTGMSTGPHLHFEVHEHGVPKNPATFIQKR